MNSNNQMPDISVKKASISSPINHDDFYDMNLASNQELKYVSSVLKTVPTFSTTPIKPSAYKQFQYSVQELFNSNSHSKHIGSSKSFEGINIIQRNVNGKTIVSGLLIDNCLHSLESAEKLSKAKTDIGLKTKTLLRALKTGSHYKIKSGQKKIGSKLYVHDNGDITRQTGFFKKKKDELIATNLTPQLLKKKAIDSFKQKWLLNQKQNPRICL